MPLVWVYCWPPRDRLGAQLIAYESFPYSGNLNGQGTAGTGFGSTWVVGFGTATLPAGSLSPDASTPSAGLTTAGNKLSLSPVATAGFASRTLATPIVGTLNSVLWMSIVMKGDPAGLTGAAGQGAFVFRPASGTGGFSITTGTQRNQPPTTVPSATWSLSDASSGFFEAASAVPNTLQSLLVARVTFGAANDLVDLFINPAWV